MAMARTLPPTAPRPPFASSPVGQLKGAHQLQGSKGVGSLPPAAKQGKVATTAAAAPSECGTNAGWWNRKSKAGPSSVASYPETAITDRGGGGIEGSMTGTELAAWLARIDRLETAVTEERDRRRKFEEELRELDPKSFETFLVSRGNLLSAAVAGPPGGRTPEGKMLGSPGPRT